jgi:hypothetical protein
MSSAVERFVNVAREFTSWCRSSAGPDAVANARTALIHLVNLYRAGLSLPMDPPCGEDGTRPVIEHLPDARSTVLEHFRSLPFQYYSEVYNPQPVGSEEPVVGDIHDDLLDIYVDVAKGLAIHDHGDIENADWEWQFSFKTHWGAHAVSAIRVLHCWLEDQHVL